MKVTWEHTSKRTRTSERQATQWHTLVRQTAAVSVILVCIVSGCGRMDQPLIFETEQFAISYGESGSPKGYAHVHILIPRVRAGSGLVADSLNSVIVSHTTNLLVAFISGAVPSDSLSTLGDAFIAHYRSFKEAFPQSAQEWTIDITGTVPYQASDIFSLIFETTAYTGGAHPITTRSSLNRSPVTGHQLGIEYVFPDTTLLVRCAEEQFRNSYGLPPGESLTENGFWFPGNSFALAETWYLTGSGIHFHYNPYEIAPYASGSFDITISRL